MEGLKHIDEWTRIAEQLPPLNTVFSVDYGVLADHLADLPDTVNSLLRLFDGRRTANEVVAESEHPDLSTLDTLSQLYFEGIIAVSRPTENGGANQTVPDYKTSVPPPAVPTLADALIQTASAMSQQKIDAEEPKPIQTPPPPQAAPPEQKPKTPILAPPPAEAFTQAPSVNDTQASDAQDDSSQLKPEQSIWDLKASVTAQDAKSIITQPPETMTVMPDEDERFPEFQEAEESGGMGSIDDDFFGTASYGVSNESSFYEEPANDNEDIAPTKGPKIALILVGLILAVAGWLAFSFGNKVKPISIAEDALHTDWHSAELKKRPPVGQTKVIAASWHIPSEPSGGPRPDHARFRGCATVKV